MNEEEVNEAMLQAASDIPEIFQDGLFKYEDVDYLEVELFKFPITCLSSEFLVRICKPFPFILDKEIIRIPWKKGASQNIEEQVKDIVLKRWKKGLTWTQEEIDEMEEGKAKE